MSGCRHQDQDMHAATFDRSVSLFCPKADHPTQRDRIEPSRADGAVLRQSTPSLLSSHLAVCIHLEGLQSPPRPELLSHGLAVQPNRTGKLVNPHSLPLLSLVLDISSLFSAIPPISRIL